MSYNQQIACRVEGKLDRIKVEEALMGLLTRHESLRTSFQMIGDDPVQFIHENVEFEVQYYNLATGDTPGIGEITDPYENFVRPFNLSGAPLLRARLVKEDERNHIFMLDIHHIISDGISINTLTKEFHLLYTGKQLSPLELQYKDFSLWQNKGLDNQEVIKQEKYWLKRFEGDIPRLELPTDYPKSHMQRLEGDVLIFQLDRELIAGMRQVLANTETTLYILLLAVYNILLSIYAVKKDIIVGSPVAGRKHESLQNIVGMFVNILVMRNYPEEDKTFRDFLNEVKENSINAFDNQDYQFDELVDELGIERSMHRYPLLEAVFNLQNTEIDAPGGTGSEGKDDSTGIVLYPYSSEKVTPIFDLMLEAFEIGENIKMCLTFSTELYNASTIEKIKEHYIEILEQVTTDIDVKLGDIEISHDLVTAASEILKEEKGDFAF